MWGVGGWRRRRRRRRRRQQNANKQKNRMQKNLPFCLLLGDDTAAAAAAAAGGGRRRQLGRPSLHKFHSESDAFLPAHKNIYRRGSELPLLPLLKKKKNLFVANTQQAGPSPSERRSSPKHCYQGSRRRCSQKKYCCCCRRRRSDLVRRSKTLGRLKKTHYILREMHNESQSEKKHRRRWRRLQQQRKRPCLSPKYSRSLTARGGPPS